MNGRYSYFDEKCAAKLVTAYVTDLNDHNTVVSYYTFSILSYVHIIRLLIHRVLLPLEVDVLNHLVEQAQQRQWCRG